MKYWNCSPRVGVALAGLLASAAMVSAQATKPDTATRKVAVTKARTAPAVLRIVTTVRPTSFTGKCPATLHWTAHLTVRNPPVTVQYQWQRSDSATAPTNEIVIRKTEGVIGGETWQLGGDKEHLVVWERLHVVSPNVVNSRAASVKVTCR